MRYLIFTSNGYDPESQLDNLLLPDTLAHPFRVEEHDGPLGEVWDERVVGCDEKVGYRKVEWIHETAGR